MNGKWPKVALYEPDGAGGIAHYTYELAQGLAKHGCRVTLMTAESYELMALSRQFDVWPLHKKSRLKSIVARVASLMSRVGSPAAVPFIPETVLPTSGFVGWWVHQIQTARVALVLLKATLVLVLNGTRVVHVQWLLDRRADLLFIRLLRLFRIQIVYTVHDVLPHDEYTAENKKFFQALYRCPDILIVHSEFNRQELLELFTVEPKRLRVIPHGVRSLFLDHFAVSREKARKQLELPGDARVLLFFGLIKRYKGLDYLLEAFDTIKSRCGKAMLLIAGRIDDRDRDAFNHYSAMMARYAGRDDVRFRNEYVPVGEVMQYFAAADLVVLPYVTASQSGVLLSAYAAGKPVVVTQTGGLPEAVRHGYSGFVIPPRDPAAIAEACAAVLTDPAVGEKIGREGRLLADTIYSWTSIAASTLELYTSLVSRSGSSQSGESTPAASAVSRL